MIKAKLILPLGISLLLNWTVNARAEEAPACRRVFNGSSTAEAPKKPNLLDAPDGAHLRSNWSMDYSVNSMAQAIIERVEQQEREENVDEKILAAQGASPEAPQFHAVDLMKDADIMLFFPSATLPSIEKNGFLNAHQVPNRNKSVATLPELRALLENIAIGLKLGTTGLENRLRPKSAFLNIRTESFVGDREAGQVERYGDVTAVFNDKVKKRSLWSSLDFLFNMAKATQTASSFSGSPKLARALHFLPYFQPKKNLSRLEVSKYIGSFNRQGLTDVQDGTRAVLYFEANVYGDLKIKDDVDYFLVENEASARSLFKFGKPVYQRLRIVKYQRDIFIRGQQYVPEGQIVDNAFRQSDGRRWISSLFKGIDLSADPIRISDEQKLNADMSYFDVATAQDQTFRVYVAPDRGGYNDLKSRLNLGKLFHAGPDQLFAEVEAGKSFSGNHFLVLRIIQNH